MPDDLADDFIEPDNIIVPDDFDERMRERMSNLGREGGRQKSQAKAESARRNVRKALAKRYPHDPRWRDQSNDEQS